MKALILIVALAFISCVVADYKFTANVFLSSIPGITGYLNGTMTYYYNTTSNAVNHWKRLDWGTPISSIELYDYAKLIRYKKCSSTCDSETYSNSVERLFYDSVNDVAELDYIQTTCRHYSRTNDATGISDLYVDTTTTPGKQILCRIKKTDGTTIDFSRFQVDVAPLTKLTESSGWGCPVPTCSRVMDIVLVVDESGSISTTATNCSYICDPAQYASCTATTCSSYTDRSKNIPKYCVKKCFALSEWAEQISFCKSIAASYEIGPRASTIGSVFFDSDSRIVSYLTGSASDFNTALNTGRGGGATCIGCGLYTARSIFNKPVSGRTDLNPSKVLILLTDGEPNVYTYNYLTEANYLKNTLGVLVIGVGIGAGADMAVIRSISSTVPGVDTAISASSFATLSTILNKLISQTCTQLPAQDCTGCSGYCSCGKTCICPMCGTSDACTTYSCSPSTKGCITTINSCDDRNDCTDQRCDTIKGCIYTNITCKSGDACKVDKCAASGGCYTEKKTCPENKCFTATCSSVTGCGLNKVTCDDGNPCTYDLCDNSTGCYFVPMVCEDNNACTDNTCVNGTCPFPEISCDDGKGCTTDSCDSSSGCQHKTVTCDDGNDCTINACVANSTNSYYCTLTHIPNCTDTCKLNPVNCSAPEWKRPCMKGTCTAAADGIHSTCKYESLLSGECNSGNLCILDTCDNATDICSHSPVQCTPQACFDVACNPQNGQCEKTARVCSNPDPCFTSTCNPATDRCENTPVCPSQPCFDETCVVTNNVPQCIYQARNCSSGSACILDTCNNATNQCEHTEITCDDFDACTTDTCNSTVGCVFTPKTCDDGDLCTLDKCNSTTGCYNPDKCIDGLFCTDDYCNPVTGYCAYTPIDCTNDADASSSCFVSACSEKAHCYKRFSTSAVTDVCGGCVDVLSTNSTYDGNTTDTSCLSSWSQSQVVTAIAGAALAGIIIAAVIGGLIVLAASSFGTYELVKRAKEAQNTQTVSNPLYKDSGREMTSSLYSGN